MGRTVYVPSSAYATEYATHSFGDDKETGEYDELQEQDDWDWAIESLADALCARYPSFSLDRDCSPSSLGLSGGYYEREVAPLVSNRFGAVCVSEYCGLIAVFFVPFDTEGSYYGDQRSQYALACAFGERLNLRPIVQEIFGGAYVKVGTFSNGEAVYSKAV